MMRVVSHPIFLCLVEEPRLPVEVCFGVSANNTPTVSYLKHVSRMKQELQPAYQLAQATAEKMNQGNKARYDQKVRYHILTVGDIVLIRNLGLKGKQKLADRGSANPCVVESQLPGIPVYRLKPADVDGPAKVMHRNYIFPQGQEVRLSSQVDLRPTPSPRALRRWRAKEMHKVVQKSAESENSPCSVKVHPQECTSSDSESEFEFYVDYVADTLSQVKAVKQSEASVPGVEGLESSDSRTISEIPVIPLHGLNF